MNICILVKEFPPDIIGGTETQTLRMARELQSHGHNVTVYTKSYSGPEKLDPDFDLVRVPNWKVSSFVSTLTFLIAAVVFLFRDADHYDVLHCMMIYPNGFIGYLVNSVLGLPYFAWIRGGDYYFMKDNPVKRWMIERVLADTKVLVQSEAIRRDVHAEYPDTDLTVLGNGVDIPDETADGDAVIFVGRLKEWKGLDVLINALSGTDERLLVVGDGPERERLESLASSKNVSAEFVGMVDPDEVGSYLQRGKLFVLPSTGSEGLPNSLLEAMAAGLPVVATDTGGVADVVDDGVNGYVVTPGDSNELRDRIKRIARDPDNRARMSENAREYAVDNHSWVGITSSLTDVYEDVR